LPILRVEIVERPGTEPDPGLARSLAESAGRVFGSRPGSTWVILTRRSALDYAENGEEGEHYPVFVRVLVRDPPSGAKLREEVSALTDAIARECGREPSEVHLLYEPAARGRMAFGGRLLD
jgi:phenylpyruvate tautomerase PptA (4-oxalocrotonate tautomerase family)